ncbi:MAG: hypothetical protein ACK4KT_02680 [Thermaurantimonas sp.]
MNAVVKPREVFYFFLTSAAILAFISAIMPESGFRIFGIKVQFADIKDFLPASQDLASAKAHADTTRLLRKDQIEFSEKPALKESPVLTKRAILSYSGVTSPLARFYELQIRAEQQKVRIFHFGDSQIENDRISSLLREKWQSVLGGGGMGYLPANAWIPHLSAEHSNSSNWVRYTAFGKSHAEVPHRMFGPYQSFARFTAFDTSVCTDLAHAWIEVGASGRGYPKSRHYTLLKILLGNNLLPVELSISENDVEIKKVHIDPLPESDTVISVQLQNPGSHVRIEFEGRHSPDVYGISLESTRGLVLDNVPMRGADGTSFSRSDIRQIERYMRRENTALIIMQFGGNAIPYLRDQTHGGHVARQISHQVRLLSKISVNAPVLFIGPSDMAIKVKDKFVSHPLLSDFRDSLRYHTTQAGAAYFDLMEAMGGEGSMIRWVQSDPPLASTDYVHFTPAGARQAAEILFEILESDKKKHIQLMKVQSTDKSHNNDTAQSPLE